MSTSFQTTSRHLLISVIEELLNAGHKITVLKKYVSGDKEELPIELSGKGIVFISVPIKPAKKRKLAARYFKDIEYVIKCRKYLNTKFDAVFVQSTNIAGLFFFMLQKKQQNAIKTLNVQDAFPDNAAYSGTLNRNGMLFRMFHKMQSYAYRNSDHIIVISEDIKDLVKDYGVNSYKIHVVLNWSYQDDLYSKESVNLNAVSDIFIKDKYHVVYAGNIGMMQNVDALVNVASEMKEDNEIIFDIIGNGVFKDKLQKRANDLGLTNVRFFQMQSADFAPAIYCSADINIIPLGDNIFRTALPSKTATCLACQKPIIFAIGNRSKFGKWISSQTGCPVIDANNLQEWVDAIRLLKQGKITCNTEATYKKYFSKSTNSKKYVEIITSK